MQLLRSETLVVENRLFGPVLAAEDALTIFVFPFSVRQLHEMLVSQLLEELKACAYITAEFRFQLVFGFLFQVRGKFCFFFARREPASQELLRGSD